MPAGWNVDEWHGREDKPEIEVMEIPIETVSVNVFAEVTSPDRHAGVAINFGPSNPGEPGRFTIPFREAGMLDSFIRVLRRHRRTVWGS